MKKVIIAASLLAFGASTPVLAQGIETVVISATKRQQTLQEVPISVAVVSGKLLEDSGARQFNDLQTTVPNLQIDHTNGNFNITIRGLGAGAGNLSFEQSVGLFVDGVYSSRSRSFQSPFLDIERVEVVRGPQGALFGKNTNAGAISIVTRRPTDTFEAEGRAGYEMEYGGYHAQGIVSGPLNDWASGRLVAKVQQVGSYLKNDFTGRMETNTNDWIVRGSLLLNPTESLEAFIKVESANTKTKGGTLIFNKIGNPGCALCTAARTQGGPNVQEFPEFRRTERNFPGTQEGDQTRTWNVSGQLDWELDNNWTLTSITGYQWLRSFNDNEFDGALTFLMSQITESSWSIFQEVRASGEIFENMDLLAGVTYIGDKIDIQQASVFNGASVPVPGPLNGVSTRIFHQDGSSISPYINLDYKATEELSISGSLRYSASNKDATIRHVVTGVLAPTNLPYNLTGKYDDALWDYSGKVRYAFTPEMSVYVSYATGTKSGGFVSNDGALLFNVINFKSPIDYQPEEAKSWEIGGKFKLFDNTLDLNIALFDTKFTNLQVSVYNGLVFVTGNAAQATSQGIELDTEWAATEWLRLGGSLGYVSAYYDDYPGGACLYNQPTPPCTPQTNNLAGYQLTRAPKWKGTSFVQVNHDIGEDLKMSGRMNVSFVSRSYLGADLNPLNSDPGHVMLDGQIGIAAADDRWELLLIGRNLTNQVTLSHGFNTPAFGGDSHMVSINKPRMITIEGKIRY